MPNLKLPSKKEINLAFASFSKREGLVFMGLVVVLFLSTLLILENINKSLQVNMPFHGGSISEGVIGAPRFINPVLASTLTDQDMVALIYSGLMRKGPDGTLSPDLAEKYDMSKNGLIYTFTLKDNIYFQDNTPVTAEDILFTVAKVKDSVIKSPHKAEWDGVTAEKIDDKTVQFTLKQPYASFLENATLGIMPEHVWGDTPLELNDANTNPVGSGPYMVSSVSKQSSGVINYYKLGEFKKFILGEPYIQNFNIYFYANEDGLMQALKNKQVDQISSVTPENAELLKTDTTHTIYASVLPRVFGLFFNQNQNQLFTDKVIVNAINQAIDKDRIVATVLSGYGATINDPIPPNMLAYQKLTEKSDMSREDTLRKVRDSLAKDGWTKGTDGFLEKTVVDKKKKKTTTTLEFSISTGNAPELARTAELVKDDLTAIGMKVDVKTFEVGNLNQGVIRPRKYDVLLFGEIVNHESDLYAFWHSSQRKDPGLNVAMYTNAKVDKILEDAFVTIDPEARTKKYAQFESEVQKDMPAVFLYSPDFIYVVSKDLRGVSMDHIISPSDRFLDVYNWYTNTENVWKIFAK